MRMWVHLVIALILAESVAHAHDLSTYGGMYRSRDFGATWFPADTGLFLGSTLDVAVDPRDANHLLLATDAGLLRSHNGGRDWQAEVSITGTVFSVLFRDDGHALAATAQGVYASDRGAAWRALETATTSARKLIADARGKEIFLITANGLFRLTGEKITAFAPALPAGEVTAWLPASAYAIVDGNLWRQQNRIWQNEPGDWRSGQVQAIAAGANGATWLMAGEQLYRNDAGGTTWQKIGNALPDSPTLVNSLQVSDDAQVIALTTHRGLMRSRDGGASWSMLEDSLPHLEGGPLLRDPHDANTLYAGFSLSPYSEIWRRALTASDALRRAATTRLVVAGALLAAILAAGALLARKLMRRPQAS